MSGDCDFEYAKGGRSNGSGVEGCNPPPMLNLSENKVDGLAFIGLSLTRNRFSSEPRSHPASVTRQHAFDLNELQDRDYLCVASTSDDGWLAGGGEGEGPRSSKLPAADSAHCEIMRVGCLGAAQGGLSVEQICAVLESGDILIPHMALTPSFLHKNQDKPPELELKFNLEVIASLPCDQWPNWQLEFLHNQLFSHPALQCPGRFCPGPFHTTLARKVTFRSPRHMRKYFQRSSDVISRWRRTGPQLLEPEESLVALAACKSEIVETTIHAECIKNDSDDDVCGDDDDYDDSNGCNVAVNSEDRAVSNIDGDTAAANSDGDGRSSPADFTVLPSLRGQQRRTPNGVYLFRHRAQPLRYFAPSFHPPYDTPAQRAVIRHWLDRRWDAAALQWAPRPLPPCPMLSLSPPMSPVAVAAPSPLSAASNKPKPGSKANSTRKLKTVRAD